MRNLSMRILPLQGRAAAGRFTLVDDEDFDWLDASRWLYRIGWVELSRVRGLPSVSVRTTQGVSLPRAVLAHHGHEIAGLVTRHRNGWRLDNRKDNLILDTRGGNARSGRRKNICAVGDEWRLVIGETDYGLFPTKEAAHAAYQEIARTLGYATTIEQERLLEEVVGALAAFVKQGIIVDDPVAERFEDRFRMKKYSDCQNV